MRSPFKIAEFAADYTLADDPPGPISFNDLMVKSVTPVVKPYRRNHRSSCYAQRQGQVSQSLSAAIPARRDAATPLYTSPQFDEEFCLENCCARGLGQERSDELLPGA